jgi:hypothetical protein
MIGMGIDLFIVACNVIWLPIFKKNIYCGFSNFGTLEHRISVFSLMYDMFYQIFRFS